MALDYQKKTYIPERPDTLKRTTYGLSNQWVDFFAQHNGKVLEVDLRNPKQVEKLLEDNERLKRQLRSFDNRPVGIPIEEFDHFTPKLNLNAGATQTKSPNSKKPRSLSEKIHRMYTGSNQYRSPIFSSPARVGGESMRDWQEIHEVPMPDHFTPLPKIGKVGQTYQIPQMTPAPEPAHMRYYKSGGYDDWHKASLKASLQQQMSRPSKQSIYGAPKLRNGRGGGSWRHVKQVLQGIGSRIVFVDGTTSLDDKYRRKTYIEDLSQQPNSYDLAFDTIQARKTIPGARSSYTSIPAQKGVEKNNWYLVR